MNTIWGDLCQRRRHMGVALNVGIGDQRAFNIQFTIVEQRNVQVDGPWRKLISASMTPHLTFYAA